MAGLQRVSANDAAHVVPRIDGKPVVPPIAHLSTTLCELNKSTEANVLAYLRAIQGLGFEVSGWTLTGRRAAIRTGWATTAFR